MWDNRPEDGMNCAGGRPRTNEGGFHTMDTFLLMNLWFHTMGQVYITLPTFFLATLPKLN